MTDGVPNSDTQPRRAGAQAVAQPVIGLLPGQGGTAPAEVVADLYRAHALGLVRMATALAGDQATAEDVVQDCFIGLYRALPRLTDPDKALAYLRASVVNGCRSVCQFPESSARMTEVVCTSGQGYLQPTRTATQPWPTSRSEYLP
jgi:hypothetical protein